MQEVFHMRISNHPILTFSKESMVDFTLDGKFLQGVAGEPIAAALYAAGIKTLRHSHKRNRPRGLFCAIGNCSSCLMTVDGVPNVRVCVEPLQAGMVVETQAGKGKII
jgi:predicted molibdopterin-dependent oxidoreductase YjgC